MAGKMSHHRFRNNFKSRLKSFSSLTDASQFKYVTVTQLATDGFSYKGEEDFVVCDLCGLGLASFRSLVDTYSLHAMYSPHCQFVVSRRRYERRRGRIKDGKKSQNWPTDNNELSKHVTVFADHHSNLTDNGRSTSPSSESQQDDYEKIHSRWIKRCKGSLLPGSRDSSNMKDERSRFETFTNTKISSIAERAQLACRGLYSGKKRREGTITCAFCEFSIKEQDEGDLDAVKILESHREASPGCHMLTGRSCGNVPDVLNNTCWSDRLGERTRNSQDDLEDLGINKKPAAYPELAVEERRKTTFLTYPHSCGKLDTQKLCKAGYFYEGDGTAVTCFSCGLKSGDWGSNEDPWKRHARSSTSCQFIIDQKGRDFVAATLEELGEYRKPKEENKINNVTPRMLRPRWDRDVVQKALSMGMNKESVRTVITNRIKKGEQDFRYVAEIYKAVNDLAVPEQELSTQPEFTLPTVVQLPSDPVREDLQSPEQSESAVDETEEVRVTSDSAVTSIMDTTESTSAATSSTEDLSKSGDQAKTWISRLTCSVCLAKEVGIIFLPCAHLVCCVDCAAAVQHCPICRHEIRATIRAAFKHMG